MKMTPEEIQSTYDHLMKGASENLLLSNCRNGLNMAGDYERASILKDTAISYSVDSKPEDY